jgi:hypothetical protein
MSYVGMTMSRVSFDPHQENIGMYGFCPVPTSGQSPKLKSISISGRETFRARDKRMASKNILNPTY